MRTKEVADLLGMSPSWVKNHSKKLRVKYEKKGKRRWRVFTDKDVEYLRGVIASDKTENTQKTAKNHSESPIESTELKWIKERLEQADRERQDWQREREELRKERQGLQEMIKELTRTNSVLNQKQVGVLPDPEQPKKKRRFLGIFPV